MVDNHRKGIYTLGKEIPGGYDGMDYLLDLFCI
jgi:hypothetical protein